jgi:hypothetical protein
MQCGAPAARRRRLEKIPGRNRMGLVALNDPVPSGRAPQPPTPSPHPADRPRPSSKAGVPFRGHCYAIGTIWGRCAKLGTDLRLKLLRPARRREDALWPPTSRFDTMPSSPSLQCQTQRR